MKDHWNRCDQCGRFISLMDFYDGVATHKMLEPSSDLGNETWETLCKDHHEQPNGVNDASRKDILQETH